MRVINLVLLLCACADAQFGWIADGYRGATNLARDYVVNPVGNTVNRYAVQPTITAARATRNFVRNEVVPVAQATAEVVSNDARAVGNWYRQGLESQAKILVRWVWVSYIFGFFLCPVTVYD